MDDKLRNLAKKAYKSGHKPSYRAFLEELRTHKMVPVYSKWVEEAIDAYDFKRLDKALASIIRREL